MEAAEKDLPPGSDLCVLPVCVPSLLPPCLHPLAMSVKSEWTCAIWLTCDLRAFATTMCRPEGNAQSKSRSMRRQQSLAEWKLRCVDLQESLA